MRLRTGGLVAAGLGVTRHVSNGRRNVNGIALMSHSGPAWQRGYRGSTHRQPANKASPWKNASNNWHRMPSGQVPRTWNSPPSRRTLFSEAGGGGGGVSNAGWQMVWSQVSGSPSFHCSQTKVGSSQCRFRLHTGAPHSGPFATSRQEHPLWTDAPFSKTSYGRQVDPAGHTPPQVA